MPSAKLRPATDRVDLIVVGGGVAGSSLAAVIARAGISVLVLEKSIQYQDRVKGETWVPWGAAEASRLGLANTLLAAGGHHSDSMVLYDPTLPSGGTPGATAGPPEAPEGPGPFINIIHPAACQALTDAAVAGGAEIVRGVESVDVRIGRDPSVRFTTGNGRWRQVACRLVVGADGRSSRARRQAAITLHRQSAPHLISGLLVEGVDGWPQTENAFGTVDDVNFYTMPQGPGRCRFYICHEAGDTHRFAGESGTHRFLAAMRKACLPYAELISHAKPAGPCRTYGAEDTWTETPYAEGLVLIGDAAGYNNPIIGQGLSLAMRDVRIVSGLLLGADQWSPRLFRAYGSERAERMRRVRTVARIAATLFAQFGADAQRLRRTTMTRMAQDPSLALWRASIGLGPDAVPDLIFDEAFSDRLLAA
jgi:2-polyprenyl-6-methoxyphenol hydroxylase-like FAD-dependent oxidoreductase